MVLISVDFPQPLGPRIATCSPALIRRLKSSSATLSPRITRTFFKSTRAGPMTSPKPSMITKTFLLHTGFGIRPPEFHMDACDLAAPACCRHFLEQIERLPARCRSYSMPEEPPRCGLGMENEMLLVQGVYSARELFNTVERFAHEARYPYSRHRHHNSGSYSSSGRGAGKGPRAIPV